MTMIVVEAPLGQVSGDDDQQDEARDDQEDVGDRRQHCVHPTADVAREDAHQQLHRGDDRSGHQAHHELSRAP